MQTPCFNDNRHQIKAKPVYNSSEDTNGRLNMKIPSVFSPIPCKPQSQCSIFGVRGDPNTPYTPFNRQDVFNKPSPGNTGKAFKENAQPLSIFQQTSKGNKITPGQFLRVAKPLPGDGMVSASPKNPSSLYSLFGGNPMNTSLLRRQTPK